MRATTAFSAPSFVSLRQARQERTCARPRRLVTTNIATSLSDVLGAAKPSSRSPLACHESIASRARGSAAGHRLSPTAPQARHGRRTCRGDSCRQLPVARQERASAAHRFRSLVERSPVVRSGRSGRRRLPNVEGTHPPGGRRRIAGLVAHGPVLAAGEAHGCHPCARRLSIREATSSISRRSASSVSKAATSPAISWRRSLCADSTRAILIASERFIPDASSRERARSASSSRRTDIAFGMAGVYHNL